MPNRRPTPSLVYGAVAALVVGGPLAVGAIYQHGTGVRPTGGPVEIKPVTIVQQELQDFPYVTIPLSQLAGLNIPDIQLPLPIGLAPDGGIVIPNLSDLGFPAAEPIPAPSATQPAPAPSDPPSETVPDETRVKEVTSETPFSVVALTGAVDTLASYVRAQLGDGSWGPWYPLEASEGENPEVASASDAVEGTEPIYVGETRRVQFLTAAAGADDLPHVDHPGEDHPAAENPAGGAAPSTDPAGVEGQLVPSDGSAPASVEYRPASYEQPTDQLVDSLKAVMINTGVGAEDGGYQGVSQSFSGSPRVITRAEWGADESQRCAPTYDSSIGGATVHHTAGSNDYTRAESAGILRAIYQYHTQTLNWCDVGYQALVDKYGQIFEGRFGGIDRPVRGSHAGGFNENTVGVAMMGDFSRVRPTDAMLQAVGQYLGWRLDLAGLDPQGWTTMYSEGTRFTFVRQGDSIRLPVIFAHRDVGRTSCPGDAGYAAMPQIRQIAADYIANKNRPTTTAPTTGAPTSSPGADQLVTDETGATSTTRAESVRDLAASLLAALDSSPVVQRWVQAGGETGFLGQALTGLLSGPNGVSHADFAGGSIYSDASGETALVVGRILDEFRVLGGELGILGAPIGDEYAVPEGRRSDFQNGSLVYNQVSQTVTRVEAPPRAEVPETTPTTAPATEAPAPATPAPAAPAPAAIDAPAVVAPAPVAEAPLQPVE